MNKTTYLWIFFFWYAFTFLSGMYFAHFLAFSIYNWFSGIGTLASFLASLFCFLFIYEKVMKNED